MIEKEAWAKEAAGLDYEVRKLVEEARRGLISAEEFMHRMLKIHGGEDTEESQGDTLYMRYRFDDPSHGLLVTRSWRLQHRYLIDEFNKALWGPGNYHKRGPGSLYRRLKAHGAFEENEDLLHDFWELGRVLNADSDSNAVMAPSLVGAYGPAGSGWQVASSEQQWNIWVRGALEKLKELDRQYPEVPDA